MNISFVKRHSEFLAPCEQAIREARDTLLAGEVVSVHFDKAESGFMGNVTVEIRESDDREFGTDWERPDPSFFPRRIVAAATALHRCGCYGRYLISHQDGTIEMSQA